MVEKINLISDTVTKPSKEMLQAMFSADVGDDVFGEDPTVNALEAKMAKMFGKEAAVFCPSGTMTNQIAIKMHTNPLDEMICNSTSHVYTSETGGYAFNSGIAVQLIHRRDGKISARDIESNIKKDHEWLPSSKLVVIENSCNLAGGAYYTLQEIDPIADICKKNKLTLHLDGARLFNVLVETKESTKEVGKRFDSISICLSKGLGAPAGSVLLGSQAKIKMARRYRKVMGGGMRQAGYLAAAGIWALDHNIDRLKIDNERAKKIDTLLQQQAYIDALRTVQTNIVIFDLKKSITSSDFLQKLARHNINAAAFGPHTIRFVLHKDISSKMFEKTMDVLENIS